MNAQSNRRRGVEGSSPVSAQSCAGDAGTESRFSRGEILDLAEHWREEFPGLLARANRIRRKRFGGAVRICSIVPGKLGGCSGDCRWCAQSVHVGKQAAKRTELKKIVTEAMEAASWGSAYIGIVNSGLRPSRRDLDEVIRAAEAVDKASGGTIGVCASLGELSAEQAERLADSYIGRYHHNLETSRAFFPSMVSTHTYEEKLRTLQTAATAGLKICCGGLFGLGESWADRVDLALTLRDEIRPDVVPLNFLIPMPQTPLASLKTLQPREILAVIALFRIILPDVDIKVAGGRETNLRSLQSWIFHAGATSCMVGNYLTTAGRSPAEDLQMLQDLEMDIVRQFPVMK
jgi:biotin synthase